MKCWWKGNTNDMKSWPLPPWLPLRGRNGEGICIHDFRRAWASVKVQTFVIVGVYMRAPGGVASGLCWP